MTVRMQKRFEKKNCLTEETQTFSDWRAGRWHSQLPENAMQCALANPSADNLYCALKALHAIREPDANCLAAFEALMHRSTNQFIWSKLALRLLCCHLQLGQLDAAHAIMQQYMPSKPDLLATFRARRFPTALAFFAEHYKHLLNDKLQRQAKLAHTLLINTNRVDEDLFIDLSTNQSEINTTPVTVAIVGNAPSLLHEPQGRHIDEHDIVVRFNTPVLTEKYQLYTGQRIDVWVLSPTLARQAPMSCVQAMIVSGINNLAGESGYWKYLARHSGVSQLALFRQEIWYELVATLQAPPTAGLLLLTSLARMKGLRVSAFGFSGDCNGSDFDINERAIQANRRPCANHYADSQSASTRHNWGAEAKLLSEWYETP